MPTLPREFTELIDDAILPLDDESAEPLDELSAAELALVSDRAVNLLGEGWGTHLVRLGVDKATIPAPISAAELRASASFAAISGGGRTLPAADADADELRLWQHAIQAIAGRVAGAPKALALPRWGADGWYGGETRDAVAALQVWKNLPSETGQLDAATATAIAETLDAHPPPDIFARPTVIAHLVGQVKGPTPSAVQRIVAIARGIAEATEDPFTVEVQGRTYSYKADHFGVPPAFIGLLRAPGGVAYSLREGVEFWKCNIFGGTVLSLAEVPVPTHRVGKFRHFPRAERFGDALARSRGWTMVRHLDHRDPQNPEIAIRGDAQNEEIRALLAEIRPGDLFFADNPGPPGSDGGHTRVCVEAAAADDSDVAPLFAQARHSAACVQHDGMMRVGFGRQIQFWLVRYTG
ncbi:MAG: peptidoglycan-binding protein [Myxococcales bacterium]|nr:peptidoglycan-binding protein [Myxococcales bacterium]